MANGLSWKLKDQQWQRTDWTAAWANLIQGNWLEAARANIEFLDCNTSCSY